MRSQWGSFSDVAVDSEGRLYGAGHGSLNGGQIVVLRTDGTGVPDPGCGRGGLFQWDLSAGDDFATEIAVSADGLGYLNVESPGAVDEDGHIARLTSTGSADAQFGTAGLVVQDIGEDDELEDIAVGADGVIVAAGETRATSTSEWNMVTLRFGGGSLPDFAGEWSAAGSMFGSCLRAVDSDASTDVGTWQATGSCTAANADPWRAIPASSAAAGSTLARTTVAGTLGARAHLRFGMRVALDQPWASTSPR